MAPPKGNQFWKLRSKHGRDKLFETPKLLWKAACEFFEWCDSNPWNKVEQAKGNPKPEKNDDGTWTFPPNLINIPTQRPYTLSGLVLYLNASESYWQNFKRGQLSNDFLTIIKQIEDIITTQQFEGAAVGAFNANIIARKLGLVEKAEVDHTTKGDSLNKQPDLSKLTDEELRIRADIDRKTYGA